jgi:hypothetical protein
MPIRELVEFLSSRPATPAMVWSTIFLLSPDGIRRNPFTHTSIKVVMLYEKVNEGKAPEQFPFRRGMKSGVGTP